MAHSQGSGLWLPAEPRSDPAALRPGRPWESGWAEGGAAHTGRAQRQPSGREGAWGLFESALVTRQMGISPMCPGVLSVSSVWVRTKTVVFLWQKEKVLWAS